MLGLPKWNVLRKEYKILYGEKGGSRREGRKVNFRDKKKKKKRKKRKKKGKGKREGKKKGRKK